MCPYHQAPILTHQTRIPFWPDLKLYIFNKHINNIITFMFWWQLIRYIHGIHKKTAMLSHLYCFSVLHHNKNNIKCFLNRSLPGHINAIPAADQHWQPSEPAGTQGTLKDKHTPPWGWDISCWGCFVDCLYLHLCMLIHLGNLEAWAYCSLEERCSCTCSSCYLDALHLLMHHSQSIQTQFTAPEKWK